jgi:hypothetical protein
MYFIIIHLWKSMLSKINIGRKREDFARPDMALLKELFPEINVPFLI